MSAKRRALLSCLASAALLAGCDSSTHSSTADADTDLPNILFIVLDDFGIDQLPVFGYGGATPAHTPNLDVIAQAGVRFRNAWSMPTCSPTRATFFEGRYPFRTDVRNAIVTADLANSQVSPYEITTPKLLKQKGYVNAVIGKMHVTGSDLNPANHPLGDKAMHELGWDYFEGYLDGGPYPIDTTAGGVAPEGTYTCGFVPATRHDSAIGADSGACWQPDGSCTALNLAAGDTPGRVCLERGGIFDPGKTCGPTMPSYLDFTEQNGYYTGEWIINHPDGNAEVVPVSDSRYRGYRSVIETDRAVEWIRTRTANQPWMLSLGYSAIHTPLQQPPHSLLPPGAVSTSGFTCSGTAEARILTNQMIEALDKEIGRLLVEAGLARYRQDGSLDYRPQETRTAVIIMGDNGTYGPSVKAPFDPTRAKGFPYQTGVWVPLIVAGPMVAEPGRTLPHMVNSADMFSLFAELAGMDVRDAIPESRQIDAQPVLPYLTNPAQAAIRNTNYSETGSNIQNPADTPPPCVIPTYNTCAQLFPQASVCEDQGGIWYGPGGVAGEAGLKTCCDVNAYLVAQGGSAVDLLPSSQRAIRNASYKLVQKETLSCATGQLEVTDEFYEVDEATPVPRIDYAIYDLLTQPALTPEQEQNYTALKSDMARLRDSHVQCPGDGNLDLVVDARDIEGWTRFSRENGGRSSWYDFNFDGLTNEADLEIIHANMGRDCRARAS